MKFYPYLLSLTLTLNSFASLEKSSLFIDGKGHSDQVKIIIGEELKYSYPLNVVNQLLSEGEKEAFDKIATDSDVFDFYGLNSLEAEKPVEKNYHNFLKTYSSYDQQLENYSNANISQGLNRAFKGGVVVLTTVAAAGATVGSMGVLTPVAVAAAGYVATEMSDQFYENAQKATKEEMINQLGAVLKTVVDEEALYLLADLTPDSLREIDERFQLQDYLNTLKVCDNCDPQKEAHLRNAMVTNLSNIVKGNTKDLMQLKQSINNLSDNVEENKENIVAIGNRLNSFGKGLESFGRNLVNLQEEMGVGQREINNKLSKMTGAIEENTKSIGQNKKLILENQKDLKFVKDFMFSQMSPAQKLMALKSGAYGNNMLEDKKELLLKQLKFQTDVGDFLNGARQISQIASNLGINLGKFDNAINIGTSAFNAATKLLSPSPDFLGAAVAITGIFGQRRDVNGIRHEQIMRSLGIINKKLDVVLENQIKILKGQEEILKSLELISRQIHESTNILYDKVELVRLDVKDNKAGIKEGLRTPLVACNAFISNLNNVLNEPLSVSPIMARHQQFKTRRTQFDKCRAISEILSKYKQDSLFSVLLSKTYENLDEDDVKNKYVKELYQPLVKYFQELADSEEMFERFFTLGLVSIDDPITLSRYSKLITENNHYQRVLSGKEWQGYDRRLELGKLLNNPLSQKAVVEVSKITNQIFTYFDLTYNGDFPKNLEELLSISGSGKNSLGYESLQHINVLLQTVSVQMNLLTGQILLPLMYKHLNAGTKLDTIQKILDKSEVIKDNFLAYFVTNKMYEKSGISYYSELRGSSPFERAIEIRKDFLVEESLNISESNHLKVICGDSCVLKVGDDTSSFNIELKSLKDRNNLTKLQQHPSSKEILGWLQITKENMFGYTYEKSIEAEEGMPASSMYRYMIYNSARSLPRVNSRAFERNYIHSLSNF
ncbi:hypothetical protein [Bacteriovorax sp. Seq25_V]|uniref:hypothetical protein n=1 Tax=Bacteriovorax sp. Seq25_V TaxID=1201288 RepID=UPI00038A4636|nr:hypothetical protein [Bacteriovorax sp. Seq25_V]EQC46660.1 hypothetical protein M900_2331 [Bacteriovorax sp. Seq25_V]